MIYQTSYHEKQCNYYNLFNKVYRTPKQKISGKSSTFNIEFLSFSTQTSYSARRVISKYLNYLIIHSSYSHEGHKSKWFSKVFQALYFLYLFDDCNHSSCANFYQISRKSTWSKFVNSRFGG